MILPRIGTKILIPVIIAFIITGITVVLIANISLTSVIDSSQSSVYNAQVQTIWETLNRADKRLQKTGLVEAYKDDFQARTIELLRDTYIDDQSQDIYPFIITNDGTVILHPVLKTGDTSAAELYLIQRLISDNEGHFEDSYQGRKKWYIYKRYDPWMWTIGFAVPLDIKYRDVYKLRIILIVVITIISSFVMVLLGLFLIKQIRPIVCLTQASEDISTGNLDISIDESGSDEIAVLAKSFNRMRESISVQLQDLNAEISERRRAEQELQNTRNYIYDIINSMPSIIIGVDVDGLVTHWNSQASRETGISALEAIGKPFYDVVPHIATEKYLVSKAIETRKEQFDCRRLHYRDDERSFEDLTIFPLKSNGTQGAVIRIDDVTKQVHLERLINQSEKITSIAGLAAGMAHEINNPLAVISQSIQTIFRRISPEMKKNREVADAKDIDLNQMKSYLEDRKILPLLDGSREAVERAAEIVRNMLQFSRKSSAELVDTDLVTLIEKSIELGASDYDLKKKYDFKFIEILRDYDNDLPNIKCCESEIEQVLLNLFKNALQAMEAFNQKEFKPQFIIRLKKEKEYLKIELVDNGPGIPAQIQERIFEPFFTTKPAGAGTGLGLSVSYSIITQNHGGTFDVESEDGKGTTFIIRLPR